VPVSSGTAWAVVDPGNGGERILRTTDGGRSWRDATPRRLAAQASAPEVTFLGARDAFTSVGRELLTTVNGGASWRVARGPLPAGCVPGPFVSRGTGWCSSGGAAAGSENLILYRTTDGGRHWRLMERTGPTQATSTPGSLPFACDKALGFTSPRVGWAGQDCAGFVDVLYQTTNGGARWVARPITGIPASLDEAELAIGPPVTSDRAGAGVISVNGDDVLIYRTEDGGRSWQAVVPPGGVRSWYPDVVSPGGWRLATAERILATADGGRSWRVIAPHWPLPRVSPQQELPMIQFVTALTGWAEFSRGDRTTVLHTTDGGAHWTVVQTP
jgi:photosystem II stability/assembly factor-like uncharacterized protein